MKRISVIVLVFAALAVGCRGQLTPNPISYTCPPSDGTAYSALNSNTPATALTYNDTKPVAGVYCYIVQSVLDQTGKPRLISLPSNISGPVTLSGSNSTTLAWGAPASGPAPTGYVASRAAALQSTLLAPNTVNNTVASDVKPALPNLQQMQPVYLSLAEPLKLRAKPF